MLLRSFVLIEDGEVRCILKLRMVINRLPSASHVLFWVLPHDSALVKKSSQSSFIATNYPQYEFNEVVKLQLQN